MIVYLLYIKFFWLFDCSRPDFTVTTYSLSPKGFHPVTANSSITTKVHRDLSPIRIFQTPTAHWKPRKGEILGLPFHCQCTQFCFISFSTGSPWNRIFFVGQISSRPSMTGKQAFDGHWSLQIWSLNPTNNFIDSNKIPYATFNPDTFGKNIYS